MATRRTSAPAPLRDIDAAVLLAGTGAVPPGGATDAPAWETLTDAGVVRLWRAHETYLRSVAAAWSWEPTFWIVEPASGGRSFLRQFRECASTEWELPRAARPSDHGPYFFGEALMARGRDAGRG